MSIKLFIAIPFLVFISFILQAWEAGAQVVPVNPAGVLDSMSNVSGLKPYTEGMQPLSKKERASADEFYDSLQSRYSRKGFFPRTIGKLLIVKRRIPVDTEMQFIDERDEIKQYNGKTIGRITINREDIYDNQQQWIKRFMNTIHVTSHEATIKRDLLFDSGDTFDADEIVRNNQLIRDRRYILYSRIEVSPDPDDSTRVNININTRDKWSISATGRVRVKKEQRISAQVYDANIFGTGDRLGVTTNLKRKDNVYGGNSVEYSSPNILGTFYTLNFAAGKDFESSTLRASLNKDFISPTDYKIGVSYMKDRNELYELLQADTLRYTMIGQHNFDVWAGKSIYIKPIKSSIYFTGRYNQVRFFDRPHVGPKLNMGFHNHKDALMAVGLYREKFYSATMIYGFGFEEYIAAGYRAEIVGGYEWGEYADNVYMGINARVGGHTRAGYFGGGFSLGGYRNTLTGEINRSALDVDFKWYSKLFIAGRSRMRQFSTLNHTYGWNRGEGDGSLLMLTSECGPRSLKYYASGENRTVLNTETVLFTPWHPVGFRVAMFAFADFSLIGPHNNIFHNDFYTTFGIGVRLKNERLIFNTIQIRLGFAVGPSGFVRSRIVRFNTQSKLEPYRFTPGIPDHVSYF